MTQPGAIAALAATCHHVTSSLPLGETAAAKAHVAAANAELADAGTSRNPRFLDATGGLAGLRADLDTIADDLTIAATHIRAFRDQLG